MHNLESENLNDRGLVAVKARLVAAEPNDMTVEKVIGRLSLESSVTSAGWDVHSR